MVVNNRISEISTTTPLFSSRKEKNFKAIISPTKSLDFSRQSIYNESYLQRDVSANTTSYERSQSSHTLSSGNQSFITADFYIGSQSDDIHNNGYPTINSDTLYDDKGVVLKEQNTVIDGFIEDTTPLVTSQSRVFSGQDLITPKITSYESDNELSFEPPINMKKNEINQMLNGLGISSNDPIPNSRENFEREMRNSGSPGRAVRMSKIINSKHLSHRESMMPDIPIPNYSYDSSPQYKNDFSNSEYDSTDYDNEKSIDLNSRDFHVSSTYDTNLLNKSPVNNKNSQHFDDQNLAYLFIVATHSFSASTLQNPDDVSICLSFEKDDVAFVHTVDESGWGEVTLVKDQIRGWVPFNYFSDTVRNDESIKGDGHNLHNLIETRKPLEKLLTTCAKYLLFPQDEPLPYSSKYTFNIEYINAVRDGVKNLLEMTDCVSRSNHLVQAKSNVRKARKKLLADWYNLMIKADQYKNTTSEVHIKTLIDFVYEVLKRSFSFYATWSTEKNLFEKENNSQQLTTSSIADQSKSMRKSSIRCQVQLLESPPNASARLHDIYDILFTYIGLILGRLDLIEHNPNGCEILEFIVHQMIILLRELLYISKSCSSIIQQKYNESYENSLDRSLDPLLSLVSKLVSCIKLLVTQTLNEDYNSNQQQFQIKPDSYLHTDQGKHLILIVSHMASLIANAITGCSNYIKIIGDFTLDSDREYPDLKKIKITPETFIERCSFGLVKRIGKYSIKTSLISASNQTQGSGSSQNKLISRYSTIRAGGNDKLAFTYEGTKYLQELIPDKPFSRDSIFEKFRVDESEDTNSTYTQDEKNNINNSELMNDEVIRNKEGDIIGISFRALVYKLTDEVDKVDDFFIATVLLNFKSFGSVYDFIDMLITRFDVTYKPKQIYNVTSGHYSSKPSIIKTRRKLVCKIFQTWMESYWDYETDYEFLPTLVNFYNEGMSLSLPLEAKLLIKKAAKLFVSSPSSKTKRIKQIVPKLISRNKSPQRSTSLMTNLSTISDNTRASVFSLDDRVIEKYELTHVTTSSNHASFSLPIPILNIGRSALLTKINIQAMEKLVSLYRGATGYSLSNTNTTEFPLKDDIDLLIKEWSETISNPKISYPNIVSNDLNLVSLNPLEVAKQLTLIESILFMRIEPLELVNDNFLEKKLPLNLTPNVNLIVKFTNQLSNYVIEGILDPNISNKVRASRLKGWLKIALSVLYFRNFNSVASIMTAVQNHSVTRLTFVWDLLDSKDMELFDYLSRIIHPNNNFKVYRKKLNNLMTSNVPEGFQTTKSLLPVVPFFNLFLQDLTFISEGNSNFRNPDSFRPNKLVNIDKYFKITNTICMIQYFQVTYNTQDIFTLNKRDSLFNVTDNLDIDTNNITSIPLLQEFILDEFSRVNTLYTKGNDRGYELSLKLLGRS